MKEYVQELGNLGTADVAVITPKVMEDVIEEIRRHRRIFAQFYRTNRDLIGTKGKEIEFPKKESGITATFDVAEATGISAAEMAYSAVTIAVKKGGIGLGFTGEAIRQSNRDVIADAIKEAGEVWGDTLDIVAMEAMFPTCSTSSAGAATIGASLAIGVKTGTGLTNASLLITGATGNSIVFTGGATFTYWYVPTTNAEGDTVSCRRVTAGGSSFIAKDILQGRSDIIAEKFDPTVIIMHPDRLTEILYDTTVKFLEKSAYRGQGEVYTGELGKIWGMSCIVSNKCPRYGILLIDPSALGYELWRKPLKLVRDDYTGMSADILYFWGFGEVNYGVVNAQAYGAIAMSGTYSPTSN